MKWKVIYCEHGEDCLGCHRDEWRILEGEHSTREEAVEALKQDIETYKGQFAGEEIEVDGWKAYVQGMLDAWCEWDVIQN